MGRGISVRKVWDGYKEFLARIPGDTASSVESRVIQAIARRGIVGKKELQEMACSQQVVLRQVLSILRINGLIYYRRYCRRCYVISMPWVFFARRILGDTWQEWLKQRALGISDEELNEVEKWLELADEKDSGRLGSEEQRLAGRLRRVERFVEARLETMRYMTNLFSIVSDVVPDECSTPLSESLYKFRVLQEGGGNATSSTARTIGALPGFLDKWFLNCYAIPVLEFIPFLLRLLAGMAYAYATGYDLERYIAEIRLHAKHWKELACPSYGCYKLHEKLVDETFNRLLALLEHLHRLQRKGVANLEAVLNEYTQEWISEGIIGQKLYNYKSVVASFLLETIMEFYAWLPLILEGFETRY